MIWNAGSTPTGPSSRFGGCGGGCGSIIVYDVCVSPYAPTMHAPNWVAEHLGASSRRPRHSALINPGRVPVYTVLKSQTSR